LTASLTYMKLLISGVRKEAETVKYGLFPYCFRGMAFSCLALWFAFAHADEVGSPRILVQTSFVAGFQHHDGKRLYSRMQVGDFLELVREPRNVHDANAIRVQWQGNIIGYVPRNENETLARQFDFGNRLQGRITRLSRHRDPNRRVEFEIYAPL